MDIQLKFVNMSNDSNRSQVVIFQKNVANDFDERAVAWKVIRYCGQGDYHPFVFPMDMSVGASDSWGNYMPQLPAQNGQMFAVSLSASGDMLSPLPGAATSKTEVQVHNALPKGSINASIYKAGRLLATETSIAPEQWAWA